MVTQIFTLPQAMLDQFAEKATAIEVQVNTGRLPGYDQFVEKLFNKLEKPKEALLHAVVGVSGESGELLDAVKKHWAYNKPLDFENLVEELGDLRFYYQAILNMFGLTDETVIELNMHKLQKRYPSGEYSDEQAIARADKATLTLVNTPE